MMTNELLNYNYKKGAQRLTINRKLRLATILFTAAVIFAMLPFIGIMADGDSSFTAHAAGPSATGKASATVQLRKSASTSSKSLGRVKKNARLTITAEVFTSKKSTSSSSRWYAVKVGKKSGYIKVNRVKNIKYAAVKATATDALNYRKGAGTSMKKLGTAPFGMQVTAYLPARAKGSSATWYKVKVGKKTAYMAGEYLDFANSAGGSSVVNNREIAAKLLANPTNAGKARVVFNLNSKNCSRKMMVTGYAKGKVPQGMAYTGNAYHILFGMGDGQSIVTYSAAGQRLSAVKIPSNIGKPNAMTWDPETGLCYIMKGSQTKIYTWSPSTGRFGTSKTPYSSSGLSYDRATRRIYATSLSGIRVYSADGRFSHQKFFSKCSHSGKTYVQDCGAYGGFIFHAISGSNKFGTNYVDVYRAADSTYLGSLSVNLGELESVIVDNEGFVELLVNHGGTYYDYIWKTPLNVKDLM